jgi:allantoinase
LRRFARHRVFCAASIAINLEPDATISPVQGIRSASIVTPGEIRPGVVLFEEGKILNVVSEAPAGADVIDAAECLVFPGFVDVHAHINEPGRTHWEGFETATRAAAAGGFTCVIDMPLNSIPSTTDVPALEQKRTAASGKAVIDYAFWGGVVPGNTQELRLLAEAGVLGFKCFLIHPGTAEFAMVTEKDLREAMPEIAKLGVPLLAHSEVPEPVAAATANVADCDWRRYETYLASRPEAAEIQAIRLLIQLCEETGCRVHIVHLSAASAIPMLRQARSEGLHITVETCSHYLFFDSESVPDGATQYKCAPPIRSKQNQDALWQALSNGVIDLIATDHSPCPPELKCFETGDFGKAWGGISSLSVSVPAMWTAAKSRGFGPLDLTRWMAQRPAELAGLASRKGRISPGFDADFTVLDPQAAFEVTTDRLHFRHPCSPYITQHLKGEIRMTTVRGNICFENGRFAEHPCGHEVRV